MAAGMHGAGRLRHNFPFLRRLLDDGVNVGPEGYGGSRFSTPEQGGAAGLHIKVDEFQPQGGQLFLQKGGGTRLPPAQLRVAMEVVFELPERRKKRLSLFQQDIHNDLSLISWCCVERNNNSEVSPVVFGGDLYYNYTLFTEWTLMRIPTYSIIPVTLDHKEETPGWHNSRMIFPKEAYPRPS